MSGCGRQLTTEEKQADFEYLFTVLSENHPYLALKARAEDYDWIAHKPDFEQWISSTKNDTEFAQTINRILTLINNAHTSICDSIPIPWTRSVPANRQAWGDECAKTSATKVEYWFRLSRPQSGAALQLPVQAVYNDGEYLVDWVSPQASGRNIQLGATVSDVDGQQVHQYVSGLRGECHLFLDPIHKRLYLPVLAPPASDQPLTVSFVNPDGSRVETSLQFNVRQPSPPTYPTNRATQQGNVYTTVLADGKVGYVRVNGMQSGTDEGLKAFIERAKALPALIIDIRGNGGGTDSFWTEQIVKPLGFRVKTMDMLLSARSGSYLKPFLTCSGQAFVAPAEALTPRQLGNLPPELLTPSYCGIQDLRFDLPTPTASDYAGRIYLLVDSGVYSSSESFAMFCKASRWATIVGTCTGGDGGGFDPVMLVLPNSGMLIRFALSYGLNPDGTASEEHHTTPDVLVQQSRDDMLKYWDALHRGTRFTEPAPEYDTVLRECLRLATDEVQSAR